MTVALKTLPPATWGADYTRLLQGKDPDGTVPINFLPTDGLSATVSAGQGLPSILSPTVTWTSAPQCQFSFFIPAAQMQSLAIDGIYLFNVEATRGPSIVPIATGYLPVIPAPAGQASAVPPDLATIPYAARLLAKLNLTETELEMIPSLITASSNAIRSWCNRRFDQGTVVEEVPVINNGGEMDGTIRLARPPINFIQRIQARPSVALTVSNGTADTAWVYQATTGDLLSQAITGLVLNWTSSGVLSSQTITYAANMTVVGLASAINAIGSGWSATSDNTYGSWPVTEIMDGLPSKGAGPNDEPFGAAQFHVYSRTITDARFVADDGQRTGMVWVGRRWGGGIDRSWGPGAEIFADTPGMDRGKVKVTYNGGFATVPPELQLACVELAKAQMIRLRTDLILTSERGIDYQYTIDPKLIMAIPTEVLQAISRHRITNA